MYFYYNIPLPYNNSYRTSIIANLNAQSMSEALLRRKGAEREMSNLTVQSFRPRLVNENNSCKLAFAMFGPKGIDVNGNKRLSPTPSVRKSVSNLNLRPGR